MDNYNENNYQIPLRTSENYCELSEIETEAQYSDLKLNLIKMGFKEELIDHINLFFSPETVEDAVNLMTKENGVWRHNFIEDQGNRCLICLEEEDHIDYKINKNEDIIYIPNDIERDSRLTYKTILQKINDRNSNIFIDEPNRISKGEHDCNICMEPIPKERKNIVHIECNHYFCESCWMDYLKEKIKTGAVNDIKCMDYQCGYILPKKFIMFQIKEHDELIVKYDKFSRKRIITNNNNMKFCPVPNCDGYGEKENDNKYVSCSEGHKFCFSCMKDWHGKKDCQNEIDKDFEKWKKNKQIKQCPKCKYWTEKNDGCNHMTCRSCTSDWCWICRNLCDPNTHYLEGGSCAGLQFSQVNCLSNKCCLCLYKSGRFVLYWNVYWLFFLPIFGIIGNIKELDYLYLDSCCEFLYCTFSIITPLCLYICFCIPLTILLFLLFFPALFYWPLLDRILQCWEDMTDLERPL